MTITILHDASGVLAVAKPAGLPTQAPPGVVSVESVIRQQLFGDAVAAARDAGQRRHPGGFLGVPHRLDRAVSGVLLLATTPRAARQISRQFERREITKMYLAIVHARAATLAVREKSHPWPFSTWTTDGKAEVFHGRRPPLPAAADLFHSLLAEGDAFEWHDMTRKVPREARAEIVPNGSDDGRAAITTGRVLAAAGDRLLLSLEPLTGRMHQLRVQAAARGMPVVGDSLYGGEPTRSHGDERSQPIALHARRVTFHDPETAKPVEVVCPMLAGFQQEDWAAFTIDESPPSFIR